MIGTLGAPERRLLRDRRPQALDGDVAGPEPVPTARATVVRPEPFGGREEAADWLTLMRSDLEARDEEVAAAVRVLNRALRAQRAASADPYVAEVSTEHALVVRLGHGSGTAVADGRFAEALELPRAGMRRARRSMEAPEERFAALLGGRDQALVAEELVLRARADLEAERPREAALQARVAIEALLAELGGDHPLTEQREPIRDAAAAALDPAAPTPDVRAAVEAMEAELRRRRLDGQASSATRPPGQPS